MKFVAIFLVVLMVCFSFAPAAVAAERNRGGFEGFLIGCCFGIRSGAAYNDGKDLHWREWIRLIPIADLVETGRKSVFVSFDRLVEDSRFDLVDSGQVAVQHDLNAADGVDAGFDGFLGGNEGNARWIGGGRVHGQEFSGGGSGRTR